MHEYKNRILITILNYCDKFFYFKGIQLSFKYVALSPSWMILPNDQSFLSCFCLSGGYYVLPSISQQAWVKDIHLHSKLGKIYVPAHLSADIYEFSIQCQEFYPQSGFVNEPLDYNLIIFWSLTPTQDG